MATVLIPLPALDFDPTEVAVSWKVQREVTRALASPGDFCDVDPAEPDARRKSSGRARDSIGDERPAFVVRHGNYLSARWPGDAHTFAKRFAAMLEEPV